jgi:4-phytase / acid phosphatase
MKIRVALVTVACALAFVAMLCASGTPAFGAQTSTLRAVVMVSRHGVRSPIDPSKVAPYAAQPWPAWGVPPGDLTAHGYRLMELFGAFDREFYAAQGLFTVAGCPPRNAVYLYADVDERTKETARALAEGIAPNCHIAVHAAPGLRDPFFYPLPERKKPDAVAALDALRGSIGDDPNAILSAYALPLARLEEVLGCTHDACKQIRSVPTTIRSSDFGGLPYVGGGVSIATSAVDDLELEYANGFPTALTGWGRLDAQTLASLLPLLHLGFILDRAEPYAARSEGSNMLVHITATIDQAASGARNAHTRVPLAARFVDFVGHDTTIFDIATVLRLHWFLQGYQRDDLPPGGALVFEVRTPNNGGEPFVETYFMVQSLDEMRYARPLTLASPPERVPVFVPGCPRFDCPLSVFDRVVAASIEPAFVFAW